jgi:hypothetical protein
MALGCAIFLLPSNRRGVPWAFAAYGASHHDPSLPSSARPPPDAPQRDATPRPGHSLVLAEPIEYVDLTRLDVKTQLRHKFQRLPSLHAIPPNADLFLTFSNGHYSNLMLNVAALVTDLGRPIVVLAFDNATAETCTEYGLPFIWSKVRMDAVDFRQDRCVRPPGRLCGLKGGGPRSNTPRVAQIDPCTV